MTLATIAARLEVSRSTVSNAYNHPDQLSKELREQIFLTADQLGYTGPDPVARRLRRGQAGAIGVLFSEPLERTFSDPASMLFLEGLAKAGERADSGMLLIPARPSDEGASVVTNAIVDGFVLYSIPPAHPFAQAALRRQLPVVCVDQTSIGTVSWVGIDDQSAAREAAEYLLNQGHRRFGVIAYGLDLPYGAQSHDDGSELAPLTSVSSLRLAGYSQAFQGAGLEPSAISVERVNTNTVSAGADAGRRLLGTDHPPTAVLCTSDLLAVGVLEAARALGVEVPEQLSIVGFNDLPEAEGNGLTTVRQPLIDKGLQAGHLLFEDSNNQETIIELEAELVVRSTSGPAPH